MKKYLRIGALILALSLIAGLACFANSLVGNPISHMLAKRAVEDYLEEHYADMDLTIERFGFSFKTGDYFANVQSEYSIDTNFFIYADMLGNITRDSYDSYVLSGHNTYSRVWQEYKELTETVFDSPDFPYYDDICFGDLIFVEHLEQLEWERYPFYMMMSDLELDGVYDVRELGREVGELVVYVHDEEVTTEKAAEIILEVKRLFDNAGIPFRAMDFHLQYPKPEDGSQWRDGVVYSYFLYEEIREEGMTQRVQESHEEIAAYYASLDAQK